MRGFSLIELMVTIAIIAVLAAVAVPAYNNYIGKTKLNTALSAFDPAFKEWAMRYNLKQSGVTSMGDLGQYLTNVELYVNSPAGFHGNDIVRGTIANTGTALDGVQINYRPIYKNFLDVETGTIKWNCTYDPSVGAGGNAAMPTYLKEVCNCTSSNCS